MHKGLALVVLLLSLTVTPAMRVEKKAGHKTEIGERRGPCGWRGSPCPAPAPRKPAKISQPFADPAPGCTKDVANAVAKKAAEDMETWNYKIMEQKPFIYRDPKRELPDGFRMLVLRDYHGNEVKKVIKEHFGTLDEKILIQKRLELIDATNNVFSWRNIEALDGPCVKNCKIEAPRGPCRCATPPFSVRQLPYDDGEVDFYFAHGVGALSLKYKVKVPLSCKEDKWVIGNIYEKWCVGSATTCP